MNILPYYLLNLLNLFSAVPLVMGGKQHLSGLSDKLGQYQTQHRCRIHCRHRLASHHALWSVPPAATRSRRSDVLRTSLVEPGMPVAHFVSYHILDPPVYFLRKGVVWLLLAVAAELTPTVGWCISLHLSLLLIAISHVGFHSFEP